MEVYHLAKPGRWHSSSCWENSVNLMKAQTKTEAWKDNLPWKDKRQLSSIKHWNCFKCNIGETSEKQGGAHMGFSEHTDTIFNWTRFFFLNHPLGIKQTQHFHPEHYLLLLITTSADALCWQPGTGVTCHLMRKASSELRVLPQPAMLTQNHYRDVQFFYTSKKIDNKPIKKIKPWSKWHNKKLWFLFGRAKHCTNTNCKNGIL